MRLRNVIGLVAQETKHLREGSKTSGGRAAVVARARFLLGVGSLERRVEAHQARLDQVDRRVEALHSRLDLVDRRLDQIERRGATDSLAKQVEQVTDWIRHATLASEPLISVVLATRDRDSLLAHAVASVQAQAYPNWELIVVDDGSSDGTGDLLGRLAAGDGRIIAMTRGRLGVGAARNLGLSVARGEFICYLDDDNYMMPLWLKAVAWAVERQPGLEVLYGARILDVDRVPGEEAPGLPLMQLEPFDRAKLEMRNFVDLGVLAHRRDLPEAWFDESLEALVDWDLILRLSAARAPSILPVVALHYRTTAPDRISLSGRPAEAERRVREKLARDCPLRDGARPPVCKRRPPEGRP